jgi:hypothetical protein
MIKRTPKNNELRRGMNITENNKLILIMPTLRKNTIKRNKELSKTRFPTLLKPRFRK